MAGINLTSVKYQNDRVKTRAFWDELITKIRRIPGVTDAALSTNPPLNGEYGFTPFIVDGQPRPEPDQEPIVDLQTVSSDYFRMLQIPLLQGRDFDSQDTTDKANVIIVDAALGNHFFPVKIQSANRSASGEEAISAAHLACITRL